MYASTVTAAVQNVISPIFAHVFVYFLKVKDCELGAIVNKELQQRVRPINGVTSHRSVAKSDIKHCAKIVQNFDKRWNLWVESEEERKDRQKKVRCS